MEIFIYISVNLLLFFSWHFILFRVKDRLSFLDRLLGVFIISLAQIVITEMVLGIFLKKLYAIPLFFLNISISMAVLTFAVIKKEPGSVYPLSRLLNESSKRIFADILIELWEKTCLFFNILKNDRVLLTVFVIFFIELCYLLFVGYLFPSYSWDALLYHLPIVGFILQSGAIEQLPYNSLIYTFINVFPKNIDLFFLWNIIFLESDIIVDLSQLPFAISGMLAVYGIGRKLGGKKRYALYSSFLFFFAPVIILQSTVNYVDIAVSVLFIIALNFLLNRNWEALSSSYRNKALCLRYNIQLLLAGTTTGLLLGSKGSGPLFVIALSLLYFIFELKKYFFSRHKKFPDELRKRLPLKKIITRYTLYFLTPVFLLGSYWYINNWIYYGNPVYPFIVKLFGTTLFKGSFNEFLYTGPDILREMSTVNRILYVWLERVEYYYYASNLSGFGPLWFILLLPSVLFSILLSIWKKKLII